jgi:small GTP-binding protein
MEMKRLVKRRLTGTEGAARLAVLRECLDMCPNYYNGPYGELRKWILSLIDQTQTQSKVKHSEAFAIAKEGAAQVVLVGPPNAGKSSLLRALTGRQVEVGDYPFTTLRPIAGILKVQGALIQLVDLPGLIEGAVDGKGGGKALLSCVRSADAVIYVIPASGQGVQDGLQVIDEVESQASISLPSAIVINKIDLSESSAILELVQEIVPGKPALACSAETGQGLDALPGLLWDLTGLIRVYPARRGRRGTVEPVVLTPGATVEDFVGELHADWVARFRQARVTGPSAKFPGMSVGLNHVLLDGDAVELILSR